MRQSRPRRLALALPAAGLLLLAACGGSPESSPTTTSAPPTTAAPATTARPGPDCPLTGQPAPGGQVPQRPVLAVKIDNAPAGRPQYGLNATDVVYEQPVEGGLTRFIAIYQCHDAARIMPIRSGRLIDPDLLSPFGKDLLFAYSGGIQAVIDTVHSRPLVDVGANEAPAAYHRDRSRPAPHNLYSSTRELYAAGAAKGAPTSPPAPVFSFGPLSEDHQRAASVNIAYSAANVTWTWESGSSDWLRSNRDTGPSMLGGGGQVSTANVVVMKMVLFPGPYGENFLELTGQGDVQVFRNGSVVDGHWRRPALDDKPRLVDDEGHTIPLARGRTWIELVPTTVGVTVTH